MNPQRERGIQFRGKQKRKLAAIFQYWGKVYKYQEDQPQGKPKKEYVAVPGDIPCVGHGSTKAAAIEDVRAKVEYMVREYQTHLKCPPIPSPPQKMDEMLLETEEDVQADGGEILEQELFCVEIKI